MCVRAVTKAGRVPTSLHGMAPRPMPFASKVVRAVLRPFLMRIVIRDWRGAEKLPAGGFVLAPNHVSHLDPFFVSHFMVDHDLVPRFLAKDTLIHHWFSGPILRGAQMIPVYRATAGAANALRDAIASVKSGEVIVVYPEGTTTRDPECWPMSGRTGAVKIAHQAGVPLVPLMQSGAQDILWPYAKRAKFFPRRTIHIEVGDPIDLSELGDNPTDEDYERVTERLMDTLTDMMAELRQARPDHPRIDVKTLAKPKTRYRDKE